MVTSEVNKPLAGVALAILIYSPMRFVMRQFS